MKVAYIFSTQGHSVSYKLGQMILPQLENDAHGVDVAGMFFFEDNTYVLVKGNPIGERLAKVAPSERNDTRKLERLFSVVDVIDVLQ